MLTSRPISRSSRRVSPGQISGVFVDDNQPVKAGQLLVRIDDRDFRAALMSAEADVAAAKASVANYDAEIARQPSLVDQARATLKADDASIAVRARQRRALPESLGRRRGNGSGAAARVEHARRATRAAGSRSRRRWRRPSRISMYCVPSATRRPARWRAPRRRSSRRKLNLSYTEIHAPVDGKVGRRSARVGAFVTPGAPMLAIVPLSDAYVVANFQENQITHMRPGRKRAHQGRQLPGRGDSAATSIVSRLQRA